MPAGAHSVPACKPQRLPVPQEMEEEVVVPCIAAVEGREY